MLRRKCENSIKKWIESSNKALLISGARQVGKTYIIRRCLEENNINFVEFNLIEQPQLVDLLKKTTNIDQLITSLSLFTNKPIIKNKTFIFFDEIQQYKELITKIKFFVDEGSFKYILSGSLLGVEINNLTSAPVGYLESFTMYPLDFEEFLQVFNINDNLIAMLKSAFEKKEPLLEEVNNKIMDIFNLYLIVGGMPDAINKYLETKNLEDVMLVHQNIINQYKLDFTKYESENKKLMLVNSYELIPTELNEKNKRFTVKNIKDTNYQRIADSFIWLKKAGVAIPVYNVVSPEFPLILNEKSSLFKLFLSDVGLLTTMYGNATKIKILNNEKSINNGSLFENVIAQELNSHGFKGYYFNSKKQGEVDFLIEKDNEIIPIEVKSGKDYFRHSALNNIINNYNLKEAYVLANTNITVKGKITYLPIYMIMFFNQEKINITLPTYYLGESLK